MVRWLIFNNQSFDHLLLLMKQITTLMETKTVYYLLLQLFSLSWSDCLFHCSTSSSVFVSLNEPWYWFFFLFSMGLESYNNLVIADQDQWQGDRSSTQVKHRPARHNIRPSRITAVHVQWQGDRSSVWIKHRPAHLLNTADGLLNTADRRWCTIHRRGRRITAVISKGPLKPAKARPAASQSQATETPYGVSGVPPKPGPKTEAQDRDP